MAGDMESEMLEAAAVEAAGVELERRHGINPSKLMAELFGAGLPVSGVNSKGMITWNGDPTKENIELSKKIIEEHDPSMTIDQKVQAVGIDCYIAAMALLQSPDNYKTLTDEQKAWVQSSIDEAARRVAWSLNQ